MGHTWYHLGDKVADSTHQLYYRGQRIKEAYYRGELIWNWPQASSDEGTDVRFIDFDGEIVFQCSAEKFLRMSEFPACHGVHAGLSPGGFNWTLEEAKEHVQANRYLDIGCLYHTDCTVIEVTAAEPHANWGCCFSSNSDITVDYGDGTITKYSASDHVARHSHTYYDSGVYICKIYGEAWLGGADYVNMGYYYRWWYYSIDNNPEAFANTKARATSIYVGPEGQLDANALYNSICTSLGFAEGVKPLPQYGVLYSAQEVRCLIFPKSMTVVTPMSGDGKMNGVFTEAIQLRHVSFPPNWVGPFDSITFASRLDRLIFPLSTEHAGNLTRTSSLRHIQLCGVPEDWGINGSPDDCVVYVPKGTGAAWAYALPEPYNSMVMEIEPPK